MRIKCNHPLIICLVSLQIQLQIKYKTNIVKLSSTYQKKKKLSSITYLIK
jgi:hypothetical protein